MKNSFLHTWRLGVASLLAAAALAACTDEEFVREAGDQPREGALSGTAAELIRPDRVDGTLRMLDKDVEDRLLCRLSRPAAGSLTLRVEVDQEAADAYNKEHKTDYALFPSENLTLLTPGTIAQGARQSEPLRVIFERAGVEPGTYLLPLRASIDQATVQQDQAAMRFCYTVQVYEQKPETTLDQWPFIVVAYVDTNKINPMLAAQFTMSCFDLLDEMGTDVIKTWVDVVPLRRASMRRSAGGSISLELAADLHYVLENRYRYVLPLQRSGRKVLLCINDGPDMGFGCLSDGQIAEITYQIARTIEQYELDGINFFASEFDDDRADNPAPIAGSFAKLIKATKQALGDKLVTVAVDAQSSELLSVAQPGEEAGPYIDYAWPSLFDQVQNPWGEGSLLKPIAGLEQHKWGSMNQLTHGSYWAGQKALAAEIMDLYRNHAYAANVFAFYDIPSTAQGTERGAGEAFNILGLGMSDEEGLYDFMLYDINLSRDLGGAHYGTFGKDW